MSEGNGEIPFYHGDLRIKGDVFTTGQIAELMKVASRTVSKWFDRGHLRGYRIPGSNDRRVTRAALMEFIRKHNIEHLLDSLDRRSPTFVHCVCVSPSLLTALAGRGDSAVKSWDSASRFLLALSERDSSAVVIDAQSLGRACALDMVSALNRDRPGLGAVVVLASEDNGLPAPWLAAGATAVLVQPVAPDVVAGELWPAGRRANGS